MNFLKNISILSQAYNSTVKLFMHNPIYTTINRSKFTTAESLGLKKLALLHIRGHTIKKKKPHPVLMGSPLLKGVVLKTLIRKPKKPNSANRKCALVRLSSGKETVAYIPGVGHNLQEHQFVLVSAKRIRDLPGVKVRCVRGAYDLPHVGK